MENDSGGGIVDIIWDMFLEMDVEYPPTEKIFGNAKYEFIRRKILEDFGIAEVLVSGTTSGGSYSGQYLSVKGFVERLEYLRNKVLEFLTEEIRLIAKEVGFREVPKIDFSYINLRDEASILGIITNLVDRGIVSKDTTLKYLNEDYDIEREKIRAERKAEEKDENIKSFSPFKSQDEDRELKMEQIKQQTQLKLQQQKANPPKDNGRPPGTKAPQKKKRDTKPQGASCDVDDMELVQAMWIADDIQTAIDDLLNHRYCQAYNVKTLRELSAQQKEELDDFKLAFLAACDSLKCVTDQRIKQLQYEEAPEKLDSCVKQVFQQLLQKAGNKVSEKKKKQLKFNSG